MILAIKSAKINQFNLPTYIVMHIIYLHGLDSSPAADKAIITANYAKANNIGITCPNLNCSPDETVAIVLDLIKKHPNCVLIGSSLGGYFATLLSDMTGTPAILLNPSIRPDISFRRFLADKFNEQKLNNETVIYTTIGGWEIKFGDLAWFDSHRLTVKNPNKIKVLLKMGDELLDAHATQTFYQDQGAFVLAQDGGDHRISDYEKQVAMVMDWVVNLQS